MRTKNATKLNKPQYNLLHCPLFEKEFICDKMKASRNKTKIIVCGEDLEK